MMHVLLSIVDKPRIDSIIVGDEDMHLELIQVRRTSEEKDKR